MTVFVIAAASMLALTLLLLSSVLRRPGRDHRPSESDGYQAANIAIARRRMQELQTRRDTISDAQYQHERQELEIALIDDLDPEQDAHTTPASGKPFKAWSLLAAGLLIAVSSGFYLLTGSPGSIDRSQAANVPTQANKELPPLDQMIGLLEQRLQQNPENADGWALAGRTYMMINRFADAERAYQKLHQLVGDDPDVLTAWADASIMTDEGQFSDEIIDRLERALVMDPNQINALWLAGMAAQAAGDQQQALDYWRRLLPLTANDAEANAEVKALLQQIEPAVANAAGPEINNRVDDLVNAPVNEQPEKTAAGIALTVHVSIAAALSDQVSADDTIFVFARAEQGPPMPLAASRFKVSELPLTVVLDDSLAMMPQFKLSNFERVIVAARVSRLGDPIPEAGDLESEAVAIGLPYGDGIELVVDRVRR